MFIIKYKKIFHSLLIVLVLVSVIFIIAFGLKPGIDFKGGALLEVDYSNSSSGRPEVSLLENKIKTLNINQALIQPTGTSGYLIKTRDLSEPEHQILSSSLSLDNKYPLLEKSFTSIGPVVGNELKRKAI